MRVLALDTATEACSVALLIGDEFICRFEEPGRGHSGRVLDMVSGVLAEGGVVLGALDGIAASVGPGSFTGVRISVAAAQGLAFGANLPVVPVSTLEALSLQVLREGAEAALACLDARMGEVYWGCFAVDAAVGVTAIGESRVGAPGSVALPAITGSGRGGAGAAGAAAAYQGIGRGFAAYPALAEIPGVILAPHRAGALPHAREMARLGAIRLKAGEGRDPAALEALYLRNKVALTTAERAAKTP
jgi:tRNA threonylcarbamoyladenosine biosynthesis protein TsaB